MTLHSIMNKYNLHTFSGDVELTEDEAQKADECCFYIRALLQKGWNKVVGVGEQMTIDDCGNQYLTERSARNG